MPSETRTHLVNPNRTALTKLHREAIKRLDTVPDDAPVPRDGVNQDQALRFVYDKKTNNHAWGDAYTSMHVDLASKILPHLKAYDGSYNNNDPRLKHVVGGTVDRQGNVYTDHESNADKDVRLDRGARKELKKRGIAAPDYTPDRKSDPIEDDVNEDIKYEKDMAERKAQAKHMFRRIAL